MSHPVSSSQRLADLFNSALFPTIPADQRYAGVSANPTQASTAIHDLIEPHLPYHFVSHPSLVDETIEPLLQRLAASVFPLDPDGDGDERDFFEHFRNMSPGLIDNFRTRLHGASFSGEPDLQSFLYSTLISAVNHFLACLVRLADERNRSNSIKPFQLMWRLAGSGAKAKSDFELVLVWTESKKEIVLAVIEVKRTDLLDLEGLSRLQDFMEGRHGPPLMLATRDDLVAKPPVRYSRVRDAVDKKWYSGIVQLTGEIVVHKPKVIGLLTGRHLLVLEVDDASHAGRTTTVNVSRRIDGGEEATEEELAMNFVGAVVGMSLRALEKAELLHLLLPEEADEGMEVERTGDSYAFDPESKDDGNDNSNHPSSGGNDSNPSQTPPRNFHARQGGHGLNDSSIDDAVTPPKQVRYSIGGLVTPESSPSELDRKSDAATVSNRAQLPKRAAPPALTRTWLDWRNEGATAAQQLPPSPRISPTWVLAPSQVGSSILWLKASAIASCHPSMSEVISIDNPFYGPLYPGSDLPSSGLPRLSAHTSDTSTSSPSAQARNHHDLGQPIGQGQTSVVWSNRCPGRDLDNALASTPETIFKLVNIDGFPETVAANNMWAFTSSTVRSSVWREAVVLDGPLKDLQGKYVPRFEGLWGSLQPRIGARQRGSWQGMWTSSGGTTGAGAPDGRQGMMAEPGSMGEGGYGTAAELLEAADVGGEHNGTESDGASDMDVAEVWCIVMQDVGGPIDISEKGRFTLRERTVEAYRRIHDRGVLHNDVHWRHLRETGLKRDVVVIDFGNAKLREECDSQRIWEVETARELSEVKELFDV